MKKCPYAEKCGGCDYQGVSYQDQLNKKQKYAERLLGQFCTVKTIQGADDPYHYRNKVHAVLTKTRKGQVLSGIYEEHSHRVVPVDECQIENEKADAIIRDIRDSLNSFKISVYDENTHTGLIRHVIVRTASNTGQILVVLVVTSPVFPSKNNFVKYLLNKHPDITSVVLNINDKRTSMVLGKRDIVIYGTGYIQDIICGNKFYISAQSFYQINPPQAEKLYMKAIQLASLTGKELVIDAYCGTGTIGLCAASRAKEVVGIELNPEAVKDAIRNAKANGITNVRFINADAGEVMQQIASEGESVDVIILDPPRTGCTDAFIHSIAKLSPTRVVYVSCNPETQARDMSLLLKMGYTASEVWPYDFFPFTEHVETVVSLSRK